MAMEMNKPSIVMLFVQLVYAGMALLSKSAIAHGMNPYVFVVYRQAIATLFLAPFAFFLDRVESVQIKQCHGLAKVLGTIVGVSGAFVFAFVKGPPLKFMSFSYPANSREVSIWFSSKGQWLKGSLMMLSANTAWSFWLNMQACLMKQYPAKLRLVTLQCFFSCIQSAIWAIAMERNMSSWKLGWDANLFSVVYCGIVVVGITYWLQLWAIEKKGPVFTAMFTPLALILTAIFSAILWKEILHLGSVCGTILLVGGLYGVLWGKNKEVKTEPNEERAQMEEETTLECIVHK
ncbi:hypothetical protein RJ639_042229 [Escallonia herrerae]|uniref:WAT1-related protein n=1 Tax=Escallonia herrerae TaxID=1293975 RepID=A0AA88WKA4_9ASTE|nr:hypothetical protein RJ639_042229 [Escallonia herrerae]